MIIEEKLVWFSRTVFFVLIIFVLFLSGCATPQETALKSEAKTAGMAQAIAACKDVVPPDMLELSATGQASIGRALETCLTLVIFTTKGK